MGKKLVRLSYTLTNLMKARGLQNQLKEYRIFANWEKTVGIGIARHARPLSVRGKKLYLRVDSPAWMQQLSLLKPELLDKVNQELGKDVIKDIVLNIGEIEPSETSLPQPAKVRAVLGSDDHEKIEQYMKEVIDPDIRRAVRRVIEKDLLRKKAEQGK